MRRNIWKILSMTSGSREAVDPNESSILPDWQLARKIFPRERWEPLGILDMIMLNLFPSEGPLSGAYNGALISVIFDTYLVRSYLLFPS